MSSKAFVRAYDPSKDYEALVHIFRETCDDATKVEPCCTIGSYLWCRPYAILCPDTCFVLDDGEGTPVGYIIGTPDVSDFCEKWTSQYLPAIDKSTFSNLDTKGNARAEGLLKLLWDEPELGLNKQHAGLWENYPGQLHIDILDSHQRQGHGHRLMAKFLDTLKTKGVKGVHLGMLSENKNAAKFYERLGFARYPHVLDGGASGEMGHTGSGPGGVDYLVKAI